MSLQAGGNRVTVTMRTLAIALLSVTLCLFGVAVQAQGLEASDIQRTVVGIDHPLDVDVGIEVEQITGVDQKSENYGAVATLRLAWSDPLLAFDAQQAGLTFRVMRGPDFADYARDLGTIVPSFSIQNQQGNRWIQNSLAVVHANGNVQYFEKSSLTLQAPYFDFRKYPFDRQKFYFEVVSHFPADMVRYTANTDYSGLGPKLGEEEWILENPVMELSVARGLSGLESAKAALAFEGRRHVQYYMTRIFLPLLVLITVTWSVFFLDDYRRRAEVAGANLLVFVAFNFTISSDLPKLGYLTFIDFILQWIFIVTGAIVVFNIILTYLETSGRKPLAQTLDGYVVRWVYPLGYIAIVSYAITHFLAPIKII